MNQLTNWWANLPPETQKQIEVAIITLLITVFITTVIPKVIWPTFLKIFGLGHRFGQTSLEG